MIFGGGDGDGGVSRVWGRGGSRRRRVGGVVEES